MNRVIILESLLALAAVAVLGPGTSVLVEQAARQVLALARQNRKPALAHRNLGGGPDVDGFSLRRRHLHVIQQSSRIADHHALFGAKPHMAHHKILHRRLRQAKDQRRHLAAGGGGHSRW